MTRVLTALLLGLTLIFRSTRGQRSPSASSIAQPAMCRDAPTGRRVTGRVEMTPDPRGKAMWISSEN